MRARLLSVLLLGLPLAACNRDEPPAAPPSASAPVPQTALGRTVDRAMREARREMATENISISDGISIGGRDGERPSSNLPKAEITPAGDLLVDGRQVAVDARQRALLLKYRGHVTTLAEIGMGLGVRGADLGMRAAGDAISSIFSGDTDGVEKRVEAEAGKLEAEALRLCAQLGPMLATQRELATSLPAFAPYATMTQADVDECMSERDGNNSNGAVREQVRREVRERVRGEVREAIRGPAKAGETDGAASDPAS